VSYVSVNHCCCLCRNNCERKLAIVQLIKPYQCPLDGVGNDCVAADSDADSDSADSADDDRSADEETCERFTASESALEQTLASAGKNQLPIV